MPNRARPICNEQTPVPCNGCTERILPTAEHKGCHGTCERYEIYCKKREAIRKERREKNELRSYVIDKSVLIKAETLKKKRKWGCGRE